MAGSIRTETVLAAVIASAFLLSPFGAHGEDTAAVPPVSPPSEHPTQAEVPAPTTEPPCAAHEPEAPVEYTPPLRGSPRARVAGAVRGGAQALPTPLVLVPEHVGQTISAQPSLFWHIDAVPSAGARLVFTLIDEDSIDPLVEAVLPLPSAPGTQRIRLADYGIALAPEVEYEWSVALVADPQRRASDIVSNGSIRRVAEPDALDDAATGPALYAALGLWYDALESVHDRMDRAPRDPQVRGQRAALLRAAQLHIAIE